MSLIGTMLKEPRVFTHSATALADLDSTWGVVAGVLTPQLASAGQDYPAGPTAGVTTTGGSGIGLTVNVTAVLGVISVVAVTVGGEGYRAGDIVRIDSIGGLGEGAYLELIQANLAGGTAWALGEPLSPLGVVKGAPLDSVTRNNAVAYEFPAGTEFLSNKEGATLYIGSDMDISVILEDPIDIATGIPDKVVEFTGVKAGSFLPVKVLTVTTWSTIAVPATYDDIIVMY